jgi:mycothiol maleylpyruvate isomerase-like protein
MDRSYVEQNAQQLARLRALVARASDDDLRRQLNPEWTVAATLLHVAWWDTRASWLADKIARGEPFTPEEAEPEPPDWINDSTRPFLHAIAPRAAAEMTLRIAEECDRRVAALPADKMYPNDKTSLLNAFRSGHRIEHLDEIEAALRR